MTITSPQKNRIKIKLKTYNQNLLKLSCNSIINAAKITQAKIIGPVSIPTRKKIYCVLRSPHVNKDAREHFEIRIHTKLIYIDKPSPQIIDSLMKLNMPPGVDIEVKL